MRRLSSTVIVNGNAYGRGTTPPAEVADKISNPAAWEGEEPEGLPEDGTIAEVEAWVGDDPVRASTALAAEQNRDNPRSTLVAHLERLLEE